MSDLCQRIQKRLTALHLGQRLAVEDPEVTAHVAGCALCRRFAENLSREDLNLAGEAESLGAFADAMHDQLRRHAASSAAPGPSGIPWWIVGAVTALVVGLALVLLRPPGSRSGTPGRDPVETNALKRLTAKGVALELERARRCFQQAEAAPLVELLDSEHPATRLQAARYLAQLGDLRARPALERLARGWSGDRGSETNPFAEALAEIERRSRGADRDVMSTPVAEPCAVAVPETPVSETAGPRTLVGRLAMPGLGEPVAWDLFDLAVIPLSAGASTASDQQLFPPNVEGYFHCEDLLPGRYALAGMLTSDPVADPSHQIGRLWREVTVPASGSADEPVDVGTILLEPGDLLPGDPAPSFDLLGTQGESVRLRDLAGRLVVLSFYRDVELDHSRTVLAALRTVALHYGGHRGVAVIGVLSSDDGPRAGRRQPPWTQVRVGRTGWNALHLRYDVLGVDTWPWNVVIDPDGTILAVGVASGDLGPLIEARRP